MVVVVPVVVAHPAPSRGFAPKRCLVRTLVVGPHDLLTLHGRRRLQIGVQRPHENRGGGNDGDRDESADERRASRPDAIDVDDADDVFDLFAERLRALTAQRTRARFDARRRHPLGIPTKRRLRGRRVDAGVVDRAGALDVAIGRFGTAHVFSTPGDDVGRRLARTSRAGWRGVFNEARDEIGFV